MKKFVIIIASYNNSQWYERNLASVLSQEYESYRVIYVDDCSPDSTGRLVEEYLAKNDPRGLVKLIRNTERVGAMENIYNAVHSCADDEVIVSCDGDDFLAHSGVLVRLDREYSDPNVWMTYGQYRSHPDMAIGCSRQIPSNVIEANAFRQYGWCSSHLRTFYTWLFKRIKKEDLMGQDGKFFAMGWDVAFQLPMLEMSGHRAKFIPDVLYMYNVANPINDSKVNIQLQQGIEKIVRNGKKYSRLDQA